MADAPDAGAATHRPAERSAQSDQELVFVTGASRSGTTMLARVLGNHSKIFALEELHFFGDLCPLSDIDRRLEPSAVENLAAKLVARQSEGLWGAKRVARTNESVRRICAEFAGQMPTPLQVFNAVCADAARAAGKPIACEQTPRNIYYAEIALRALPNVKFVHLIRDPRAVAASQKNRWQMRKLGADHLPRTELIRNWVNYHPITMAKLWRHATLAANNLKDHPRVYLVKFEELVTEPNAILKKLCNFLGVEFEPTMSRVPTWGSSNLRHDSPETGISTNVVNRWRDTLDKGEISLVERLAADLMAPLGYQRYGRTTTHTRLIVFRHLVSYPFHLIGVALANPRRAWIQLTAMLCRR